MVCPASFKRYSRAPKRTIASLSRLADGSSMTMALGSMAQTEAMAISCFSPLESGKIRRSSRRSMFIWLHTASTRFCITDCSMGIFSMPSTISSVVFVVKNWLRGSWNTLPTIVPSW